MFIMTTQAESDSMRREARQQSAIQGWKTRQLRALYALEDPRGPYNAPLGTDAVKWLDGLYRLEDPRLKVAAWSELPT
jgi:hypothetical protein